jgi:transposase
MSLSKQTQIRLPRIKQSLLEGLTTDQIGERLHVTEKTIDRDMKAWVDSGDFETWLKEEWLRVYVDIKKIKPIVAFEALNNLVGKMLTRKIEKKELSVEKIEISWKMENDSSASNQVQSSQGTK